MYFAAQFRAATGCRPHECILRKRIERAQQMLRDTAEPLVRIALTVGFQSHAHFSTVFKRFVEPRLSVAGRQSGGDGSSPATHRARSFMRGTKTLMA